MKGLSTSRSCASSAQCLSENEFRFIFRYYSETTKFREKVITPAEAKMLTHSNLLIATVYQDRNNQVRDFNENHGKKDGRYAYLYAQAIGQPKTSAIFFAVDFDPSEQQLRDFIVPYFIAVQQELEAQTEGSTYRVGVYGSGLTCRILKDELNIATYSWLAQSTGWRESKTYENWDIKQEFPKGGLCDIDHNYEICHSTTEDLPWAFIPSHEHQDVDPDQFPVLRFGSEGTEVRLLQQLLNSWLSEERTPLLVVDGDFGNRTYRAVKAFQSKSVDSFCNPILVDGIVGPITFSAILRYSSGQESSDCIQPAEWYQVMPSESLGGTNIGRAALQVSINELNAGAKEIGGNNQGPFVSKYLGPVDLGTPNPWCAGFLSWCFQESGFDMPFKYNPLARGILNDLKRQGLTYENVIDNKPQPGDLIFWWRNSPRSWQGHCGIVHHYKDGYVFTIEGNKTPKVQGFKYPIVEIDKLLGFARIG